MRNVGFYHEATGYVCAVLSEHDKRSDQEILKLQREGTILVPPSPSKDHRWIDGQWKFIEKVFSDSEYVGFAERYMDAQAQALGYQNRNTLVSYATSTNPKWAQEAAEFIAWRDSVYTKMYQMFEDGAKPFENEFIAMLTPTPASEKGE